MVSTILLTSVVVAAAAFALPGGAEADEFPGWAFPAPVAAMAKSMGDDAQVSVPGSDAHFNKSQLHNMSVVVDWFPTEHSTMPAIVADRHVEQKFACAYCHLPSGTGRAENAKLAGLPSAYIIAQVNSFQAGTRRSALADWPPTHYMVDGSAGLTDDEIRSAADYFSRQKAKSYVRVVESTQVPQHQPGMGIMTPLPGRPVPIGQRIVELPVDVERFENRDAHATYIAYVPVGSLKLGRKLATTGDHRTTPCATCHGVGLRGDKNLPGPPLAGRFPTYLFRQLYALQAGTRTGDAAQPMQSVVAHLTQSDMIALAAYVASLKP